ncbi:hypothetical protein BJX96DRAFT_19966 [Aspergillus floccosus]
MSFRYKEERLELQNRLNHCRDQLALQLNEKSCSEIRENMETLITSQDDSHKVVQLQQQVEELRQSLDKMHSRDNQNYIQQLLQLSQDSFHALVSQRLIQSLAFDDMYGRFDTIEKAHYNTFKWIFYGDTNSESSAGNSDEITQTIVEHTYDERQDEYRISARDSFLSWLSSDHGIFHICGKLGSGKSTLMKFLCNDARTKEALVQWAGGRTLIMASFFFWKPGSKLQKSMDGLLRALLYETLKSSPALVPKILPEQWAAISSTPWQMHIKLELRPETIREAFDRLIDSHTENLAICFFIDGLDEYQQTLQEDNLSLIRRLDSWCGNKAGNIKICVSSREYNVFMNHLPNDHRIRMQDLTNKDVELYIWANIEFVECPHQARWLVNKISFKADGIFLWVALVVKRTRELHENGASYGEILDEVDQVPRGLEELFRHILESLEPSDRRRAYQTFAIMMRLKRNNTYLPLLAYAFIDEYDKRSQQVDTLLPAESKSINDLETQALKKLRGYCKGLVENVNLQGILGQHLEWTVLQFCHRSIPEFLKSHLPDDDMKYIRSLKVEDAISRLLLAYIRKYTPESSAGRKWFCHLSYIMLKLRHEANLVNEPFHFEEQLETALAGQGMELLETDYSSLRLGYHPTRSSDIMTFYIPHSGEDYVVSSPCLISCYLGHSAYLRWKLVRLPAITDGPFKMTLIFFIIYKSVSLPDPERRLIFQILLDCGFSPHIIIPARDKSYRRHRDATVWEHFLVDIFLASLCDTTSHMMQYSMQQSGCESKHIMKGYVEARKDSISTFLEMLLELGADASIAVYICNEGGRFAELIREKQRRRLPIFHSGSVRWKVPAGLLFTLIDIIDCLEFEGTEEREKLITLVKRNIRIQGGNELESGDLRHSRETVARESAVETDLTQTRSPFGTHGTSRRSFLLISLLGLISAAFLVNLSFMSR